MAEALVLRRRHTHGRVLVAEDDPDLRAAVAMALAEDGFDVIEARDGAEALDYLERARCGGAGPMPDVVICDLRMPRCGGMALIAHAHALGQLPCIVITAFADPQTEREAHRAGATYVMDKPFELDDLRTAVLNVIR